MSTTVEIIFEGVDNASQSIEAVAKQIEDLTGLMSANAEAAEAIDQTQIQRAAQKTEALAAVNFQLSEEEQKLVDIRNQMEWFNGRTFESKLLINITKAGSVTGTGGGVVTPFAHGGDFRAGQPILVGEQGPEAIIPKSAGTVIPNNQLGGGGGFSDDQMFALSAMFDDQADRIVAGFRAAVEQVV